MKDIREKSETIKSVESSCKEIKRQNIYRLKDIKDMAKYFDQAECFYRFKNEYYIVAKRKVILDDSLERVYLPVTLGQKITIDSI